MALRASRNTGPVRRAPRPRLGDSETKRGIATSDSGEDGTAPKPRKQARRLETCCATPFPLLMALRFIFAVCLVEPETAVFAAVLVAGGRLADVVTAAAGTFHRALSTSWEEEWNSFLALFQLLTHLRGNP